MEQERHEKPKKENRRNVFETALSQVRWLDDYNGPMIEREVEFFSQPSKAQFVKSFYITSRNLIYLDSCLRSPYESVREAAKAEHERIHEVMEMAITEINGITDDLKEKAEATGLKHAMRNTSERGIVYVMVPLANIFLDAILKLDEMSFAVDTLWVDQRLSDDERLAFARRGRAVLDRVYEASSKAYHAVTDIYREVKNGEH